MSERDEMTTRDRPAGRQQAEKVVPAFSLDRCKRCGICSHFCPVEAIGVDAEGTPRLADPDACTACRLCEHLCPDFAIEMVPREDHPGPRSR